jgi:hypothetical protein
MLSVKALHDGSDPVFTVAEVDARKYIWLMKGFNKNDQS